MFGGTVERLLKAVGVQDDESDEYFNADANISELQEVLRSFQVEHHMLKNLLRDKDNEVEHYRKTAETIAAQAGGEIKVPPPPPSTTRPEEAAEAGGAEAGDERTDEESDPSADARVSLAVKALRLERRNKELVGKVQGVETMLEAMSEERSQALEECNIKEETIEKLVNEYSALSGEMRESGERDGETIALLQEEKKELEREASEVQGRLRQVTESAALVQQVTGQSAEEGMKEFQDLSAAAAEVDSLTARLEEAAARVTAAETSAASAKAEMMEAREALSAVSGQATISEEEAKKNAAAEVAAATEAAAAASRAEVQSAMIAEREKDLAALRAQLERDHGEKLTEATKKAEADREQALAAENAKYATQVKALEQTAANAEKALAEAKSEHATQVASIEQAAAEGGESALAAATARHSAQVTSLEEAIGAGESALAEAKSEHGAQVATLEEAIRKASETASSAEAALAAQKEASLELESKAQEAAEAARQGASQQEATLRARAETEMKRAREEHAAALKEAVLAAEKQAAETVSAEAATAATSVSDAAAAAEESVKAARESHAKELAEAHAATKSAQAAVSSAEAAAAEAASQQAKEAEVAELKFSEAAEKAAASAKKAAEQALEAQTSAVAAAEAAKDQAAAEAAVEAAKAADMVKEKAISVAVSAAEDVAAKAAREREEAAAAAAEQAAAAAANDLANLKKEMEEKLAAEEARLKAAEESLSKMDAKWESEMTTALEEAAVSAEESKNTAVAAEAAAKQELLDVAEKKRLEAYTDYLAENKKRKAIHNKLIELQGNIRVFARCRPMVDAELRSGKCDDVTNFPAPEDIVIQRDEITKAKFEFDQVFKPDSTQEEVFAHVKPFATSFLDGYNVCIFAYGQTGSGKTYTMEGPPENRGVNLRCLEELFRLASEERAQEMSYEFILSYLEIYNESVHDLLVEKPASGGGSAGGGKKVLEVRQSAEGNIVPGLSAVPVSSIEEVLALMERGASNRAVGSHDMNEHSSRSHSILTLNCVGTPLAEAKAASSSKDILQVTKSQLHLIDLAGSERISKTDATGERLKEAQAINKSLSSLGDVIAALGGKKGTHVPYRNSKLTFLLQGSLSGNSKVLMFCNVSPASYNVGETMCSLTFAGRCRNTELGAAKKATAESAELRKYKMMVQKLQDQISSSGNGSGDSESNANMKKSTSSSNVRKSPGKK